MNKKLKSPEQIFLFKKDGDFEVGKNVSDICMLSGSHGRDGSVCLSLPVSPLSTSLFIAGISTWKSTGNK